MSKAQRNPAFKWMLIISAVLLVPAMIYLGFWQLDRAEQKKQLIQSWSQQTHQTQLPSLDEFTTRQYLNLKLKGYLDHQRYFMLDNRFRNGVVGYEVIAPFYTEFNELILVNLGWTQAPQSRDELPVISIPMERLTVMGGARQVKTAFSLGPNSIQRQWPIRIQQLDIKHLSELLGAELLPIEIRVKQPVVSSLDLDWPVTMMMPQKHLAYAVQWFAMALALLMLVVWSWRYLNREPHQGAGI
jgi:cytochrome oxidase assembly protein ShyY1